MIRWKRAILLALLSWLIPFAVSFAVFPLKSINAPLFEAVMTLVLVLTAGLLLRAYFRAGDLSVSGAVVVGAMWLAVNLVFDYPMFAYGPMKMSAAQYYSQIGVDYLIYPAFAFGAARVASARGREAKA